MPRTPEPVQGGRPVPFAQFIVKVHGRCNLACRYCYLYAGPDRTWRTRPAAASPEVLDRTADRIAEHARTHGLRETALVLHGGEPLLVGAARLGAFADAVRDRVGPSRTVHATVQTNGTLLTERAVDTLARHSVRIGISLDGGLPAHNTLRTDHAGRPSFAAAARGARLLAGRRPEAYAGLLTVVDPRTDPVELYESLLELRPPALDLLLPHGNWTSPPPGLPAAGPGDADPPSGDAGRAGPGSRRPGHGGPGHGDPGRATPYGDWLAAVFDRWWGAGRRETRVRLFEECLALLLGLPGATESLGLDPVNAVVVETDGAIEQVDSLKSAYDTAAATGLDVRNHSFDDALRHPGVAARQSGAAALAAACRACPLLTVCGGGHYAHRYRAGHGFTQRSVYCADLERLIRHVAARLTEAAASAPAAAPGALR
ncbi:radical SAM protein [Streptomyces sp. NPDC056987]|uniref:radical SAM protein n=1 Tax=Streptomyces sp. NPDC056987 TaxID=3345988 RepID=UPI00362CB172